MESMTYNNLPIWNSKVSAGQNVLGQRTMKVIKANTRKLTLKTCLKKTLTNWQTLIKVNKEDFKNPKRSSSTHYHDLLLPYLNTEYEGCTFSLLSLSSQSHSLGLSD